MAATLYACVTGKEPISAAHRMMAGAPMPSARETAGGAYSHALSGRIDAGLLLKADQRPQTIRAWREVFSTGKWPNLRAGDETVLYEQQGCVGTSAASDGAPSARRRAPICRRRRPGGRPGCRRRLVAGPRSVAVSPQGLEPQLEAALARIMPATTPKIRKDTAAAFVQAPANRALAVAPQGAKLRWTSSWPTRDLAEEKALERCQQVYDEPCALIAVNDAIVPPGADGNWTPRDAPRVRYAGPLNIERIPGIACAGTAAFRHCELPRCRRAQGDGVQRRRRSLAVSGATSQHSAEEQALLACKAEALRQKLEGACYLYAIENRVVLPLRATGPISAAAVAAPPEPAPSEATVRARLLEGLARIVPSQQLSVRESQVAAYQSSTRHKAIAAFPPSSTWRISGRAARLSPRNARWKAARCAMVLPNIPPASSTASRLNCLQQLRPPRNSVQTMRPVPLVRLFAARRRPRSARPVYFRTLPGTSASTSSVCSPSFGAGRTECGRWWSNEIGRPTTRGPSPSPARTGS